ncbi:hypothetical protein NQ015_10125 [Corynebacterium sp. 153RC1]|uniref:hypothetical protein n=1 Tax=unclassified Corynebacterium TaxID=2624378 RepID=UPI00211C7D36|nr:MULTISPECIES: hypothetical protein [unclassified Corynebacterium]MCQ9353331.1 hypothetical protein [Corynebacterium sp. 209RC1]MCQ9355586.1 hypothetical protein [Corynebacterium sp. 1222RC1]MCQ9357770.1 hypothetical protein [Corynebacterium sp. 122RC1]MCQ9359975.1 hypothetical protein [Corynebacterium sp. 142RC1]MCQ9362107.1 hypothetical protein [Corynebacterium sp. 153RC1]
MTALQRFAQLALRPHWFLALLFVGLYAAVLKYDAPQAALLLLLAAAPLLLIRTNPGTYARHNYGPEFARTDEQLLLFTYLMIFLGAAAIYLPKGDALTTAALMVLAVAVVAWRIWRLNQRPPAAMPSTSARSRTAQRQHRIRSQAPRGGKLSAYDIVTRPLLQGWIMQVISLSILMALINVSILLGYRPSNSPQATVLVILLVTAAIGAAVQPPVQNDVRSAKLPPVFWLRQAVAMAVAAIPIVALIVTIGVWPMAGTFFSLYGFALAVAALSVPWQLVLQVAHNMVQVAVIILLPAGVLALTQMTDNKLHIGIGAVVMALLLFALFRYWGQAISQAVGLNELLGMNANAGSGRAGGEGVVGSER